MLTSTLKQALSMALVMAVLTGCSSTETKDASTENTDSSVTVGAGATDGTEGAEVQVDLETVFYFDFDQSTLKADLRALLVAHAERLKAAPTSVRLEGHADERGTREYNMALGERRANAVRDFLVLQGVDASLIETISYGEESPAVSGTGEASYAQNRRVELK